MFPSEVKILTVVSNSNSNNNNNSNKDNCNITNQDSIKNLKYTTNINKNNCLQNINNTNKQQQHKNNNAGSGGGGGGGVGGVHRRKLNSYQNRKKFHQNNNNNNNNNNNCLNKNHNNSIINTNNTNNNNKHVINNNNNDRIIKTCSISRSLSTIKQQNRKNLEQISITTNSIPLTNTSMVMNNNKSKTQQQQQQQLITTTTTSSTTVTSSLSSSQSSQPAIVVAATANSSSSSSSYSIDFLHSVRFQMTAGTNRSNYTPSSSSSSPSPSRHTQFLNNGSQQQHHHHHHHHHHHCVYDDANLIVSTTQQQQQQQQQQQHQQHQQNLNTSNQGKSSNFIVGGGGGGGNINPATRNNNNNNSNSTTTTTTTLPPPNNVQFVYQNSHGGGGSGGGYPTNPTYLNHNNFHNHHIIQYRSTNTNQPFTHNNNNNNNTNHNNRNSYHNHNNNNIPMKNWAWNPPNSIKKSHHINNMNVNKLGSISTGNLDSNSCSSNCNPLQQQQRTRNHQNHNNLTYISADSDGKIIGNSRSPTPSPKSESPSLYKQQSLQVLNKLPIVTNDLLVEHGTLMAAQISSSPSSDGTTISSVTTTTINNNNNNNNNNINNNNLGSTLTGYESDSSHSSYRHSDYIYHPKNFTSSSQSAHIQLGDISSLGNFQTFSTDDDHHHHQQQQQQQYHHRHNNNHHPAQQHHSNYGSHQNLTFWNSSANLSYSPHSTYSSGSGGSSEAGTSQYLSDGNVSTKRRGRRHLPSSFRANGFHESLYTPPDRFLARSHLIEIKQSPPNLLEGSKWDQLSQTVWDKFLISQQTEETYRKKMYLWRYLYVTIKKAYPRYGLYLVGSTISGFGADTSDVDMCLVTRNTTTMETRMEAVVMLTQLKEYLTSLNVFEQFHLIEAKVPILRFKDSMHMLEVDLNFNNCVGIHNTHLLHCYSKLDWRLRPLVLVIKLWAQFHDINNAKNMTISSYSLVLMVIHFLQFAVSPPVLPCLHDMFPEKFQILLKSNDFGFVDMNEECGPYLSQNTQPLGELFLQFLEYYSSFDYTQYAISVRTGTILPIEICRQAKSLKNDIHQWKQLCIEEPFDLTNTARSVYDGEIFERVKAVFIASWKLLNETMDINSIFSPIITTSMSQVPFNSTIS